MGVAGGEEWEDRGVYDSQAVDAVDSELVVDDGVRVFGGAHLRRADRMIDAHAFGLPEVEDLLVGLHAVAWHNLVRRVWAKRVRLVDLSLKLEALNGQITVVIGRQVVVEDLRERFRVGAARVDAAA